MIVLWKKLYYAARRSADLVVVQRRSKFRNADVQCVFSGPALRRPERDTLVGVVGRFDKLGQLGQFYVDIKDKNKYRRIMRDAQPPNLYVPQPRSGYGAIDAEAEVVGS